MKNCTKLHFRSKELVDGNTLYLEDFFLGGSLTYNDGEILYSCDGVDYVLIDEDAKLFIDFTNVTPESTFVNILPVYDAYSLKQNLECRCSIILGEVPYDVRLGIPLKSSLDEKQISIVNLINNTPGVQNCSVISTYVKQRKYTMNINIISDFGTFVVELS